MDITNKPLRGRVFFGSSLLLGFDVDNISIIETYRGLQELHLHGIHKGPGWDDELAREYSGLSMAEPDALAALGKHDWAKHPLLVQVQDMEVIDGPNRIPVAKTLKFYGILVTFVNGHMTFKPTVDPNLASGIGSAMSSFIAGKMREESFMRKLLPPLCP